MSSSVLLYEATNVIYTLLENIIPVFICIYEKRNLNYTNIVYKKIQAVLKGKQDNQMPE